MRQKPPPEIFPKRLDQQGLLQRLVKITVTNPEQPTLQLLCFLATHIRFVLFLTACTVFQGCLPLYMGKQVSSQFRQINGKQNSRLVNFIPEEHLLFALICCIYQKTATKVWDLYQRWLWKNGTFCLEHSEWENRMNFSHVTLLWEIFHQNDLKSLVPFTFHLDFPETFCKW